MKSPYGFLFLRLATWLRRSLNVVWLFVLVSYLIVVAGQSVYRNYQAQQQTKDLQTQLTTLQLEKSRLQALLVYYQTPGYQERLLRQAFLLKKPNERVYALPESNDPQYLEDLPIGDIPAPVQRPITQPIWQEWINYLLHKTS